jgi:2-polyprenyl-3-methyl-5-hydroxy-6-metoxy-1,4-benzoquinol methylase
MSTSPILENGVPIGNQVDKANLDNPIYKKLVQRFDHTLYSLVTKANPTSIHEVGCGEGRVSRLLHEWTNLQIRATDYSESLTEENRARNDDGIEYVWRPIEKLIKEKDGANLIVCCEVLEHIPDPEAALRKLHELAAAHYIFSVPNEPLWRVLNMARGKYLSDLGNTPGHVNHFSLKSLKSLLESTGFIICEARLPLPWSMVLVKTHGR